MISSLQPTRPKAGPSSSSPSSFRFPPTAPYPYSQSHQQIRSYGSPAIHSNPHTAQQIQSPLGIISYQPPRPTSNLGFSQAHTEPRFQQRPRTQMEALPPCSGVGFNPMIFRPQNLQPPFPPQLPYDASKRHPVFYPTSEERLRRLPLSDTFSNSGWTSPVAMGYEVESQAARRREGGGKL